jgi:hypothetical protein
LRTWCPDKVHSTENSGPFSPLCSSVV